MNKYQDVDEDDYAAVKEDRNDANEVMMFLALLGLLVQLMADFREGSYKRTLFYFTRQSYCIVLVYFVLRFFQRKTDKLLKIIAPLSFGVWAGYLVLNSDYYLMIDGSSIFGHIVAPIMIFGLYLQSPPDRTWYTTLAILGTFSVHMAGEYLFYYLTGEFVYPSTNVLTVMGVVKLMGIPTIAIVISLTQRYVNLTSNWVYRGVVVFMVAVWAWRLSVVAEVNRIDY